MTTTSEQQAVPVAQGYAEAEAMLRDLILPSQISDTAIRVARDHMMQFHRLASLPCKSGEGSDDPANFMRPDETAIEYARRTSSPDPLAGVGKLVRELGSPCENCGKPVEAGQLILYYDDVGEMHADCENPFSLDYDPPKDAAPAPMILLGSPMVHVPLELITHDAPQTREAEGSEADDDRLTGEEAWDALVNVDDRTSPEEYPDMCLITRDELIGFMHRADLNARGDA